MDDRRQCPATPCRTYAETRATKAARAALATTRTTRAAREAGAAPAAASATAYFGDGGWCDCLDKFSEHWGRENNYPG